MATTEKKAKEIPLTKGQVALVDEEDYERVSALRWYAHYSNYSWYAMRSTTLKQRALGARNKIYMHRFILNAPLDKEVDHRDGNGLNNTRGNLRLATRAENAANHKEYRTNSTGIAGLRPCPNGKWMAVIKVNGQTLHLGTFPTKPGAIAAREAAELKHFGDFARGQRRR